MEYLTKKQTKKNRKEFFKIYNRLKELLGDEWSTSYSLVGSTKRNLVLVGNEGYDLDYHVYMYKNPKLNDEEIKILFKNKLDDIVEDYNLTSCEDSTHVLTMNKIVDHQIEYAYDIAIMRKNKLGEYLILKNEKQNNGNGPYHFVQVPQAKGFIEKYKKIDNEEKRTKLKEIYKTKKEEQQNYSKKDRKHSFSLLLEAINEVL